MDNYQIADTLSLLSKLMDIHGENSFKSKSYSSAAFSVEKADVQISEIPREKISSIKGLGASTSQKIIELLETGKIKVLEDIILKTPPGILEMMNIKGIGPKKINTIWKEMEIESIGELLYACQENRLKLFKGFGEKTQQSIIDTIEFYQRSKGSYLFAQVELFSDQTFDFLEEQFGKGNVTITGDIKRQLEIVNSVDYIIISSKENIEKTLEKIPGFELTESNDDHLLFSAAAGIKVKLYFVTADELSFKKVLTSSSDEFSTLLLSMLPDGNYKTEEEVFSRAKLQFVPSPLREDPSILDIAGKKAIPELIQESDIKGIIHCHSNWSDGNNSIEDLAKACIAKGLEYIVITDHSKSAFYANGLSEERIRAQHEQIDELNVQLAPFRIFKGIESDILNDGNLDYKDQVLSTFDMIVASVHSNLKMTEEKSMKRLLAAISNPFTTILGHMTGRLLLSRNGYPVDHRKIIEACSEQNVVIELNSHPNRLDMDWRHIPYALEKNVMISIDPDAHFADRLSDINYGVRVAQKAMVTKKDNLSSMPLKEFDIFLKNIKKQKGITV